MKTLAVLFAGAALALLIQNTVFAPKPTTNAAAQPAYDRVLKTNTLRCAYAPFPLFLEKNPNTGALSGIMPEITQEIEKISGLKIEWVAEIDYSTIAETLRTGKADAFCTGMALTPSRGKVLTGSVPVAYAVMGTYVRQNDMRFDNNPAKIDDPKIKLEVNMGDFSEEIAKRFFPKAERVYRGAIGGEDQLFLDVAMGKADVTFSGPNNAETFNKNNPMSALRLVPFTRPIYRVPVVIGLDIHEAALANLLNASLNDLIDNGVIEKIIQKNAGAYFETAFTAPKPRS